MAGGPQYPIRGDSFPPSARQLIGAFFGVEIRTKDIESDVTVGTTPVQLGSYAHIRTGIVIGNTGSALVVVAFNPAVTITTGLPVQSNTGLVFDWYLDQEMVMHELWAISGTAGQTVHVIERVLGFA